MMTPYLQQLITESSLPLKSVEVDFAMDSSGFSTCQYVRWFDVRCLTLIKKAIPYIPFREGEKNKPNPSNKGELWRRIYHFYKYNAEEFNQHYHKRSNAETTFSMIKARFGERLRSKTETAQINEALLKVLCHSICVVIQSIYELGLEVEFIGKDVVCLQNEPI